MYTLFISDLHLDKDSTKRTRAFLRFLEKDARLADALYILGDLFEVWLGDDDDDEFAIYVQEALQRFTAEGPPVYFMHGNRDFLIRDAFCQKTGVQLLTDPTKVKLYDDQPVLLSHGDCFCTMDTEYMAFRQQARSAAWQDQILATSLMQRRQLAEHIRAQSQTMNSRKAEDIMDVTPQEVIHLMEQEEVLTLIHGHTHRPAVHDITVMGKPAQRIVLGDWDTLGWCARATPEGIALESWDI